MVPADQGGGVMRADLFAEDITGLDEALAAVDGFDRALVEGLLRPQPAQSAGLTGLAHAVAGTPLAARVAEAAEKAAGGAASEDHFVALAAARTALLGSVHDALMTRIEEATGRSRGEATAPNPPGTKRRTCSPPPAPGSPIWPAPDGRASITTWSPAPRRSSPRCFRFPGCADRRHFSTASPPNSPRPARAFPWNGFRHAAGPICGHALCCSRCPARPTCR